MPDGAPVVFVLTCMVDAMFVVSRWGVSGLALRYTFTSRGAIHANHDAGQALHGTSPLTINFLIASSGHVDVDWDVS